jgi:hypothetical protein
MLERDEDCCKIVAESDLVYSFDWLETPSTENMSRSLIDSADQSQQVLFVSIDLPFATTYPFHSNWLDSRE